MQRHLDNETTAEAEEPEEVLDASTAKMPQAAPMTQVPQGTGR